MKQLTIQEMIKSLPFSVEKRDELLANYDAYDDAQKLTVVQVCNDAFDLMYDILFDKIKDQVTTDIAAGTLHVPGNVGVEIDRRVWEDINERMHGKVQDTQELTEIREKLSSLMKKD